MLESDDRSKLQKLYDLYKDDMYRKAYYMVKDHQMAQDVMQTSIIRLTKHLAKIDEINSIKSKAYIMTIVRNLSLDSLKKASSKEVSSSDGEVIQLHEVADDNLITEEWFVNKEKAKEINRCLKEINEDYAEIIYLKFYQELSIPEISEVLGLSKNNTSVKLKRALNVFKKKVLNDDYFRGDYGIG